MASVRDWASSNIGVYLDNATSRRDFRAQLRGNRAVILWSVYLVVLIGLGMLNYSMSVSRGNVSVVEAQRSLQDFYQVVMGILGFMVLLVAPALAATTIVLERERKSLDLVFSAPVKPKSLLVGKMISAYRYTWMLLVLSLPVTAVCVVLGGETWGEVLATYALLSFHALLYSSLALAISSIAKKPVSAIVYTYFAVLVYYGITSFFFAASMASSYMSPTTEASFTITLSPLGVVQAAGTHTTLMGVAIPNWILFAIYSLFLTRLFLLGAASVLSHYNSPETKNFRISGLVAIAFFSLLITASFFGSGLYGSMSGSRSFSARGSYTYSSVAAPPSRQAQMDLAAANFFAGIPLALLFLLPLLTCAASDGERKFWPNGTFKIKEAFRGTPAGGLPYILMLLTLVGICVPLGAKLETGLWPGHIFGATLFWALGIWVFLWSLGRWASAAMSELRAARTLHLAMLMVVVGLPIPILMMFDSEQKTFLWWFYPFYPLWPTIDDPTVPRLAMGLALLAIGAIVAVSANQKSRNKLLVPPVMA